MEFEGKRYEVNDSQGVDVGDARFQSGLRMAVGSLDQVVQAVNALWKSWDSSLSVIESEKTLVHDDLRLIESNRV